MSIKVALDELAAVIEKRGPFAYVCTVSEPPSTHLTHTRVEVDGDLLSCSVGRTGQANVISRSQVVLLWPSRSGDDFSLIVDADGTIDGDSLVLRPLQAVLHRPAP